MEIKILEFSDGEAKTIKVTNARAGVNTTRNKMIHFYINKYILKINNLLVCLSLLNN